MRALSLILLSVLLAGCQNYIPFVHRPDIQQGNLLEPEQVSQLKVGMTREQVDFLLGEPVSHDSFTSHQYDYVYYFKANHEDPEYKKLTVYFDEQGVVRKIQGE